MITQTTATLPPTIAPAPAAANNAHIQEVDAVISEVARAALAEFILGTLFTSITVIFVANPITIVSIFAVTGGIVLINTALRCGLVYNVMELTKLEMEQARSPTPQRQQQILDQRDDVEMMREIVAVVCPVTFSIVDMNTRNLVTHEAGHALAAMAMYKNAHPKITITQTFPFNEGYTEWRNRELSALGQSVGPKNANIACVAGGTGLSILFSTIALGLSHKYRKSHPELSRYFLVSAITSFMHHILYALSAFWASAKDRGHDFLQLWNAGIHPIFPIVTMTVIPIIVRGAILVYDRNQQPETQPATVSFVI